MGGRNVADAPGGENLRNQGGVPHLSQIPNDSALPGDFADDALNNVSNKLVRVVITATGGTGGATAGTISVQVQNLDGTPITRAVTIALDSSLTQYAGPLAATGTAYFGAATTGTLILGSGALTALVTTNASGLYEGALADAADETAYFSARTAPGGAASNAAGCVVAECVPDDAVWSA